MGVALAGKVVLVTGSSRGIGAAVARQAAAEGAQVAVHYRAGAEQAERVVAEARAAAGADARAFQADLRDGDAAERLVGQVVQTFGRLDGLVNNAGMDQRGPTLELAPDEWDAVIATNLTAAFDCSRNAIGDLLKSDNGRLVFVASVASIRGVPYASHYAASKHGLLGLTRSLAAEYAKTNLTVNAVCPGYVDSPMTDQSVARVSEITGRSEGDARAAITNMNVNGRLVDPQAIANVIAMFCMPLSRDINGAAVTIDGGTSA